MAAAAAVAVVVVAAAVASTKWSFGAEAIDDQVGPVAGVQVNPQRGVYGEYWLG